jgi:Tol biopolymer transport system component
MDPERPGIRKQLSTHRGEPLAWSRDGSKLLLIRRRGLDNSTGRALLSVLNANGSETLLIEASGSYSLSGGSFSPDGSKVVYAEHAADGSASGIYVIDAGGGTPRLLLSSGGLPFFGATFSPDGSQIAYFKGWGDSDNSLRVMKADGHGSRVVLKDRGAMRNSWAVLGYLVWSPDGKRLAFAVGYPRVTYVVGADGSGLTRLIVDGWDLKWSPDGSRIAYNAGQGWPYELAIADADGTHAQRFDYGGSGPWNPLPREEVG